MTTCACGWRDPDSGWSTYRFDPACPEHGLDVLIAQATPHLDIDEEGGAERSEHGSDHGSAQTPLTPPG